MKMQELRNKNDAELRGELMALMLERFNLRMQKNSSQAQAGKFRSRDVSRMRRMVARIKTVLNERRERE